MLAEIIGFRFPGYLESINMPGWHLHVLTAPNDSGKRFGGHLLNIMKAPDWGLQLRSKPGAFMMHCRLTKTSARSLKPQKVKRESRRVHEAYGGFAQRFSVQCQHTVKLPAADGEYSLEPSCQTQH